MFGVFKPTLVVSVPRVFEKVYNTAEQNAPNDGKGRIFEIAAQHRDRVEPGPGRRRAGLLLEPSTRCSTGWSTASCAPRSAATATRPSPAARRWVRGSATSTAVSALTIYEGYGLTETSAAITVNRIDALKIGSVGKLVPGNSMRIADDGELLVTRRRGVQRLLAQRAGDRGGLHGRLVPHRRPRRDRRGRLPDHHRPQEGDHRHRRRQERRPGAARGPAAGASADQPGDGRRRRTSRSSAR